MHFNSKCKISQQLIILYPVSCTGIMILSGITVVRTNCDVSAGDTPLLRAS